MSTWAGVTPLIGAGSLDGFAVGALMSGACSLAIVAPRRGRRRQVAAACHGLALPVGRPEKLGQHVKPADVLGAGPERTAQGAELGTTDVSFLASRGSGPSGGYRSRHRLGDPIPSRDGASRDGASRDRMSRDGTGPASAPRTSEPGTAVPGAVEPRSAEPGAVVPGVVVPRVVVPGAVVPRIVVPPPRTSRRAAIPDSAFSGHERSGDGAHPHPEFPELAFPDGTFGTSKRPEGRRPRHAAPAVGFSSKMTTWMTSLVPARAVASGVHG